MIAAIRNADRLRSNLLNNASKVSAVELGAVRHALLGGSQLGLPFDEQVGALVRATQASTHLGDASTADLSFCFTFLGAPADQAGVDAGLVK